MEERGRPLERKYPPHVEAGDTVGHVRHARHHEWVYLKTDPEHQCKGCSASIV